MNVFQHIVKYGDDEYFVPMEGGNSTDIPIGTEARIKVYARRVERGLEINHPGDLVADIKMETPIVMSLVEHGRRIENVSRKTG